MSQIDQGDLDLTLDEYGILRRAGKWVSLTPAESVAVEMLLQSFGQVVSRNALSRCLWPDQEPSPERRSIHVLVFRIRKRIEPLGVMISTIRGQGFLMHLGATNG